MNFKPTAFNLSISLVVAMIIAIWAYSSAFVYDAPQLIEPSKRQAGITGFIVSFILLYVVTSIFQKKK